ncbi:hypothetical protein EWM64_g3226 [Hericium alpestre]|uniref:Uncharacterized protein n=1 Tax=Hericium alpestre TaxID=135208 RepID=A0A4Z0A393_9AGAM|nr:hypothetical protein EWM64_g3226 [Hericium alpestre]
MLRSRKDSMDTTLKNHEQLYFADGNIILVAQNAAA